MKKVWKILSLVLVFALVMAPIATLAAPFTPEGGEDLLNETGAASLVGTIINVLQWIGYAVAIVMVLWLGIQWMLAQPAKKAELKGKMWSMAIGLILLVGGVTVLDFIWGVVESGKDTIG